MTKPETFLNSTEDLTWLHEVHNISTDGYVCAILYGNEDAPDKVELFTRDHYKPTVYVADDDGNLKKEIA